jgi:4-diphosphocytidyl-2-C-methyl-D-erythritol kinase
MLHILGRRADGYHELQTLFQFLDYGDEITFAVRDDGVIQLHTEFEGVPHDSNLIVRRRKIQQQSGCTGHRHLDRQGAAHGRRHRRRQLERRHHPAGLNHLWQLGWDEDRLAALGLTLGADVPVFVRGHAAFAEGVGEN